MKPVLAGKLPATDKNGLDDHQADLFLAEPDKPRLVVGLVTTSKVVSNVETGESVPTVHFVQLEACDHDHPEAPKLRDVVETLYGERTGKWPLTAEVGEKGPLATTYTAEDVE